MDKGKRVLLSLTDITEQKKLTSRLQQAQKLESIGSLSGGIAHDFNNLLFPIIGLSELLLEDLTPSSPEYEKVQEILKAGNRGSQLVNQILSFSRQETQKKVPVRIQKVVKEVIKLARSTIPADIKITQCIDPDCGLVMADPTQLHQIAMNLVTNAYHAVEKNTGCIDIKVKAIRLDSGNLIDENQSPGKYAVLVVADNGVGISPTNLEKIFDPYFTTKEKGKGTGLGLSTVYGIVKEHQGDIKVYSEPGIGTTFKVFLPLMQKTDPVESDEKVEIMETGKETILLVDDEISIVRLERQMLERLGYKVTARTSSMDALEAFKSRPEKYDLVISDMNMPNMNGIQLAKEIQKTRPDMPIVLCTGFSERISREITKKIGIKGFLMKPVAKAEMAGVVRKILDEVKV
jgi:nitrogen-specific signal transduction histidine kinase/ActR/RegA family two-component response regulator